MRKMFVIDHHKYTTRYGKHSLKLTLAGDTFYTYEENEDLSEIY